MRAKWCEGEGRTPMPFRALEPKAKKRSIAGYPDNMNNRFYSLVGILPFRGISPGGYIRGYVCGLHPALQKVLRDPQIFRIDDIVKPFHTVSSPFGAYIALSHRQ